MRRKITVLINDNHKELYPSENISGVISESTLTVESVTVFWDYSNVIKNVSDTITFNGNTFRLPGGYWTFDMLTKIRDAYVVCNDTTKSYSALAGLYIARNASDGCTVYSDYGLNLGNLAPLLGFDKNTAISTQTHTLSPNPVNINRGLKYITVSCDIVDDTRNIGIDGKRSNIIATIPVPNDTDLKRAITQHYVDTGSVNGIPLQNGCYNKLSFDVNTNIGDVKVGPILLELIIDDK